MTADANLVVTPSPRPSWTSTQRRAERDRRSDPARGRRPVRPLPRRAGRRRRLARGGRPDVRDRRPARGRDRRAQDRLPRAGRLERVLLSGGRPPAPKTVLRSETTPNPDARKFVLAFNLGASGTYLGRGRPEALRPVLETDGVASLFHAQSFVTVTKAKDADWSTLEPAVTELLGKLTPG